MGKTSQDSFVHRSASSPLDGCRILVAEDESLIALDLERILEDFGCEVVGPLSIIAHQFGKTASASLVIIIREFFSLGFGRGDTISVSDSPRWAFALGAKASIQCWTQRRGGYVSRLARSHGPELA